MYVAQKILHRWSGLLIIALLMWLGGFVAFYRMIPADWDEQDIQEQADVIVVLTGGMGRLERGVELLKQGRAKMLLVSGVDKDVKPAEIVAQYGIDIHHPVLADGVSRMVLDYGPRDTVGNAHETTRWMQQHQLNRLYLVTSSYHMPRSLLEFRHAMPEATLYPAPVYPQGNLRNTVLLPRGSLRLILLEYHKYMLRKLYYALPQPLQLAPLRISRLHPHADIDFSRPEKKPEENTGASAQENTVSPDDSTTPLIDEE